MRMRTAVALVALLPLACEIIPTGADEAVTTGVVLDLSGLNAIAASQGRAPTATSATLFWDYGEGVRSLNRPIAGDSATFEFSVPEGEVRFWAGAQSGQGTTLYWSVEDTVDIRDGFSVPIILSSIQPIPVIEVLQPTTVIPGSGDPFVRTLDIAPGSFTVEIRNDQVDGPVIEAARRAQHPVMMTWKIAEDPRFTVSRDTGELAPGQKISVSVTEKPGLPAEPIAADLDVDFYFVSESDAFETETLKLREAEVALVKITSDDTVFTAHDSLLSHDSAGPAYNFGDPVYWSFMIHNTGTLSLTDLSVWDSLAHNSNPEPAFEWDCPELVGSLMPGDSIRCIVEDTVVAALYNNVAHVEARTILGPVESAPDTNWYHVSAGPESCVPLIPGSCSPSVDIEMTTNGFDADSPPGLDMSVGDQVIWRYVVTNNGNVPLSDIVVTDTTLRKQLSCPNMPDTLVKGTSATCDQQRSLATAGQYATAAAVTATTGLGSTGLPAVVSDVDPSHYFGNARPGVPGIDIEKTTDGVQADVGTGPTVRTGNAVRWEYIVKNTGTVGLSNIVVTDSDPAVDPVCGSVSGPLSPGDSIVCSASGVAGVGQYGNEGKAVGGSPIGGPVVDADWSHYFGNPLEIQKSTNGDDADTVPGPAITVGDQVVWVYKVWNHGPSDLSVQAVSDSDPALSLICPKFPALLEPDTFLICEAVGVADSGPYGNEATTTAIPVGGSTTFMDTDSSHYQGVSSQSAAAAAMRRATPAVPATPATVRWGGPVPTEPPQVSEPAWPLVRFEDLHWFNP